MSCRKALIAMTRCSMPCDSPGPFVTRNDPGNDVERDQALGCLFFAIHGERNARLAENAFRVARLLREIHRILRIQPLLEQVIRRANAVTGCQHLIEWLHVTSPSLRRCGWIARDGVTMPLQPCRVVNRSW